MANKKGVIMYYDLLEQLEDFSDENFGKLIRAIIQYDKDGTLPSFDGELKIAFKMLKPILDRNNEEYNSKCEKNRQNVLKRWNNNDTNEYDRMRTNTNYTDKDNDIDKDIDIDIKKEDKEKNTEQSSTPSKVKRFVKPSLEEVKAYCTERNNKIDAENFINFYESKGWKVGNQPMKDWKACVRTWEKRQSFSKPQENKSIHERSYSQNEINDLFDDLSSVSWK